MNKLHRGFIPIIAIILFGVMAIAGGTVAVISTRHPKPIETPVTESFSPTATTSAYSAPVSVQAVLPPATTTSTNKKKLSEPVKQTAAIPNAVQAVPPDVVSVPAQPVQAPVPVNPLKDSLAAIDAFLANPKVASLKDFCTKAKQLPGRGTQTGLDSSRTSIISTPNTLYQDIRWCGVVLDEDSISITYGHGHYTWMSYNSSLLISLNNSDDSDDIRRYKIRLNATLQTLGQYGIIGYGDSMSGADDGNGHIIIPDAGQDKLPQEVVDAIVLNYYRSSYEVLNRLNQFASSVISPVKELTGLRQDYLPR